MHKLASLLLLLIVGRAAADEGMWTFDNFPKAAVKQKYGVDISDEWLQRVQRSITRHESCTGSFISPDGLVLTNHHCVMECLSELSSPQQDYVEQGYNARSRTEERKCPTEILSVLIAQENITDKVNAATRGVPDARANELRKQELSRLEAACTAASRNDRRTGPLACESVTLYQGGQYFLYKYKRYEDVRMVFAPHHSIAAFGGDPDNFNFPRWCLDFGLLRVYEGGNPAKTPDRLPWRVAGPDANEPVFVAGHPGTTNRLFTLAQMKFQRDTTVPAFLIRNSEFRGRLIQWGKTGAEPQRIIQDLLLGYENSLKVYRGLQRSLLDDALFEQKTKHELELRSRVIADATLQGNVGDAWADIERAETRYRQIYDRHLYLENGTGFNSKLFIYARQLVRGAAERQKPNELRLREYADSNLPKLSAGLLAATPVYPEFEQVTLTFSLDKMREALGPDDNVIRTLLGSESPDSLAASLIRDSKLADPAVRKSLWDGGAQAIGASNDPFIKLARQIDPDARAVRKIYEDEVQAVIASGQEKIARARFGIYGTNTYPDATFTLRLSYGAVKGWEEKGVEVAPFSQLSRLYERTTGKAPFALPKEWLDARSKLDPQMPFNYTTTNDIVGGNSGSPVIDAQGRLVGLAFDGNMHSIAGSYWYDERVNRAVAVHPQVIIAALRDVYGATAIANEITGGKPLP